MGEYMSRMRAGLRAAAVAAAAMGAMAFGASAPADGPKGDLELGALMKLLADDRNKEASFVEQKFLKVLDDPVQSSGRLRYERPSRLEKHTDKPVRESMVLERDQVTIERDGRRRSVGIDQIPGLGALVGGLRDVLAGDASALERAYRVIVQGSEKDWQLTLLPNSTEGAKLISRLLLRGSGGELHSVETLQADGDRSLMTLTPVHAARKGRN